MQTHKSLRGTASSGRFLCVYCGCPAEGRDHTPPRCFLKHPRPANLITLPACKKCNSGFSIDEEVVRTVIALSSTHPDLVIEREPGGKVHHALMRNARLRSLIDTHVQNGNATLSGKLLDSFKRVLFKTIQGLFFGLYERIVHPDQLEVLSIQDRRVVSRDEVVDRVRPSPLRDITDEPLPTITSSSWPVRQPIIIVEKTPIDAKQQEPIRRLFRLVRETPVVWVEYQPDIFTFGFVRSEDGRAVCILELWQTIVVAVATPWPDSRGPLRRGRKNPLSRERSRKTQN
jgi:hypothetical protein